jgi:nuclear transcription factor Y gamma
MIAAEAPVLFAKACEMFILELTLRSWIHTEENKRRTLQRNDIAGAITRGDIFDFLVDIVPRDELKVRVYTAFDICCCEMARWLLTFNTRYCLVPRCLQ